MSDILKGVLIPFLGTILGAACVFLMKKNFDKAVICILTGFAAGVMTAASVWSLLLPAISKSEEKLGRLAFIPAACGFMAGIAFLLILDKLIPHIHKFSTKAEGIKTHLSPSTMLILAVTLHNLPEGMAVGAVFAGLRYGNSEVTYAAAIALSEGILREGEPAVERYLGFLSGGCSKSPIELLKGAGVDMTTAEPVNRALAMFSKLLDEMEALTA